MMEYLKLAILTQRYVSKNFSLAMKVSSTKHISMKIIKMPFIVLFIRHLDKVIPKQITDLFVENNIIFFRINHIK